MGNTNEVRQSAHKAPIMVVWTRFGEWPLYGLCMKRRSVLHLNEPPRRRVTAGGYRFRNLTNERPQIAP
jgi:hypothetical protein